MEGGGGAEGEVIKFLLKQLFDKLRECAHQIKDADKELQLLEFSQAKLQDFISKNNKIYPHTVKFISKMVFNLRDEIGESAIRMAQAKSSRFSWFKSRATKYDVSKNLRELRDTVNELIDGLPGNRTTGTDEQPPPQPGVTVEGVVGFEDEAQTITVEGVVGFEDEAQTITVEGVVGFEDEAQTIIDCLVEEKDELDVVSIVGMPGLGKTTLAYKILRDDQRLTPKFPSSNRFWVPVRPTDKASNVLLTILRQLPEWTTDYQSLGSDELAKTVRENLMKLDSFLIAIDDVWSVEFWKRLWVAFPRAHKQGKILITSQLMSVGRFANPKRDPHKLRFLTLDESHQLLHLKVYGTECPPDVESFPKSVLTKCDGLPLLILRIGESVLSSSSKQVPENFNSCVGMEHPQHGTFSLSYSRLPDHLKQCFLYLGMFPEEFNIPVWVLIRLWIAEEFIHRKGLLTLEEAAKKDLQDLVDRNLIIMNQNMSSASESKTYRVHYMVREFCKYEACSKDNLFQEITYREGQFLPPLSTLENPRRLRIDSNVQGFLNLLKLEPSSSQVSSFICFSEENLEPDNTPSIPAMLKSLRILQAKLITYNKSWHDWDNLRLLRHVVLSTKLEAIPKAISKLWNMETLVVRTTFPMLKIKANIYNMSKLRHVETNVPTKLPKPGKSKKSSNLLTLGTISDKSCTENRFAQLGSLQKLSIHGQLDKVLKDNSLAKLDGLKKLKLAHSSRPSQDLLHSYKFPKELTSLTLSATSLDWREHMCTLELLNGLEKLKLKNNAFTGDSWEVGPAGFGKLHILHVENTDLQCWTVPDNCFQELSCLVIINCMKLEEIPFGLAKIMSFSKLCLKNVEQLTSSALRILQERRRLKEKEPQYLKSTFKLYIDDKERK